MCIRDSLYAREYDWEGDRPLRLPYHRVIAYSLHVRGFTKHFSSQVKNKGTFLGVVEKIPYLTELGINQIHLMPVYDFEECLQYRNYWGYGDAYCFAPKASYSASGDAVRELKDMVKACHKAGIEVVLEMPFTGTVPKQMIDVYKRQDQGFVKEAVVNYVALLGWCPSDNQEIFSLEELVKAFDYRHMSKSPAVFDIVRLKRCV